jgi:predicted metal-binding membrane protein
MIPHWHDLSHLSHVPGAPYLPLVAMWFGMMTLMMVPTVSPWVVAVHRLGGNPAIFSSGYIAAWLLYSLVAAGIQRVLPQELPGFLAASILLVAGAFQFAPIKRACLLHCRNPLTYFLTQWRDGASGGFRMGFGHGLFCVACCWALMATTLAVGVMSLWWMAALGAVTFAEQVSPWGDRVRSGVGGVLLVAGAVEAAQYLGLSAR